MDDLALDTAAFQWREALDAATDGLDNVSRSRRALHFSTPELQARAAQLEHERDTIERDLERLAGTTHTHLHRHMHGPRACAALLSLGTAVECCVLELDGVLAPSTALHAAAWQETFDEFLSRHHLHAGAGLDPARPFGARGDYFRYLHGRPRIDGVHRFLDSRGIHLPNGDQSEAPGDETAWGVAARKNQILRRLLRQDGIRAYEGSIRFLELAREAHLGLGIVSASANTREILERAGLLGLVDDVLDGNAMSAERLRPKPEADSILGACSRLGIAPASAATFETTAAGIAAGRAAGVDRVIVVDLGAGSLGRAAAGSADRVVPELSELIDTKLT
jgi:beta-phosphoglucomutase-like phosphatase (HAD superfamily)